MTSAQEQDEFQGYKDYLAQPARPLQSDPLGEAKGENARMFGAALADPATDKRQLFATLMGRPSLEQQTTGRGESVQYAVRVTPKFNAYINEAIKREQLKNRSEYIRMLVARDAEMHHIDLAGSLV